MQQRNFIIFGVLMVLTIMGTEMLRTRLWPHANRPRRPAGETDPGGPVWAYRDRPAAEQAQVFATILAAAGQTRSGFGDIARVGVTSALADPTFTRLMFDQAAPPEPPAPPEKFETVELGDDSSFLKAVLTSRGAGVRTLALTSFQKADERGLPVVDEAGNRVPLPLIETDAEDGSAPAFALYNYLNIDRDDHPLDVLGTKVWKVESVSKPEGGPQSVTFSTTVPEQKVQISKTFSLAPGDFHLGLEVRVRATGPRPALFRYQLAGGHGLPIEGQWYTTVYRNAEIGWVDRAGAAWRHMEDAGRISVKLGSDPVTASSDVMLRYAAVSNQYFASAIAVDEQPANRNFLDRARSTVEKLSVPPPGKKHRPEFDDITVRVVTKRFEVPAEADVSHRYVLYNGPLKVRLLSQLDGPRQVSRELVDRYAHQMTLSTLTDYQSQSPTTWVRMISEAASRLGWTSLLILCTNLMHDLLGVMHQVLPNYGLCLIGLTLLVRLVMFPVTRRQSVMSMKMQALGPELKEINDKFADDPQAKTRAIWELYSRHQVNPLMGCLPLLLQMPIFLGLYYALMESIHFRLAPFLWVRNLAAPDMLWDWSFLGGIMGGWFGDIFGFYGMLGPFFNLLPFFTVALMIVQQQLMTPPAMNEEQEMQQSMTKVMMIVMGVMFYKLAAGLCLYIITTSLWGLAERWLISRTTTAPAPPGASGGSGAGAAITPKPPSKPSPARGPRNRQPNKPQTFWERLAARWEELLREAEKRNR